MLSTIVINPLNVLVVYNVQFRTVLIHKVFVDNRGDNEVKMNLKILNNKERLTRYKELLVFHLRFISSL